LRFPWITKSLITDLSSTISNLQSTPLRFMFIQHFKDTLALKSQEIPDPESEKPSDWDEEMDGDWEAGLVPNPACASAPGCGKWHVPMIDNPLFKGKWHAPLINNPNYQGKWKPRKIPNPDYFHDPEPYKMTAIGGIGIELWSMSSEIYFDNMVSDSFERKKFFSIIVKF